MVWSVDAGGRQEDFKAQWKGKDDFVEPARPSKGTLEPGSFVFVRKELYGSHNQKPKQAPDRDGPFRIVSRTDTEVVVRIDGKQKRLKWDRVVAAPAVGEHMRKKVLRYEKHDVQDERVEDEVTTKSIDGAQGKQEYVTDQFMNHSNEQRSWKLKVKWYWFASTDDTWEHIEGLPPSSFMR